MFAICRWSELIVVITVVPTIVPIESGNEIDFLNVSNTAAENKMTVIIMSYCKEPVIVQLTGVL